MELRGDNDMSNKHAIIGHETNISSLLVGHRDTVESGERYRQLEVLHGGMQRHGHRQVSEWVHVGSKKMRGRGEGVP